MNETPQSLNPFEERKKISKGGIEFWLGRELQALLGYATWENFETAIERAVVSCETTGEIAVHHFRAVTKMIKGGKGAQLPRSDYFLDRYACYLIAMNGDPKKPEIAVAQAYFAVQTRRQELSDQQALDDKRREARERVTVANKHLNSAAKAAGVRKFPIFHDKGYRGLYGGLGLSAIKRRKKIPDKSHLLDHAGRAELAANEFRITQTEERLKREKVKSELKAWETHYEVGQEVRKAIQKIGGVLPEALPAEENIKTLGRKKKLPLPIRQPLPPPSPIGS